ncbi:MAG: DUF493 domain-containing protein [Myxococcaceae bacterium]|nr:DUF493 domain-containing protein [Myxococcaceae bacterium]
MSSSPTGQPPLIEYPTAYAFKVMGKPEDDFEGFVRALFSRVLGVEVPAEAIERQPSSKGTYVSLTVTVTLHSEEHRRTVYAQLHQEKRIVYYL